jgi:hypothetical protein
VPSGRDLIPVSVWDSDLAEHGIILDPAAHTMINAYTTAFPVEEDTYGLPSSKGGLSPVTGFTPSP